MYYLPFRSFSFYAIFMSTVNRKLSRKSQNVIPRKKYFNKYLPEKKLLCFYVSQ